MKIRALLAFCLVFGGCSGADDQTADRSELIHELEVQEPVDQANPAPAREGVVQFSAPASARKPTPDPWRIAPPVDKPTPDPWSGEACNAPPEDSTGECATSETGAPPARAQTLDR